MFPNCPRDFAVSCGQIHLSELSHLGELRLPQQPSNPTDGKGQTRVNSRVFLFFLMIYLFIYFIKRELEQVGGRGRGRERERGRKADSQLSTEPDTGLDPTTLKS